MGALVNTTAAAGAAAGQQAWARVLHDSARLVALLNADDGAAADVCVSWEAAGLNPYEPATVRDVLAQQDVATVAGGFCAPQVAPHDAVLLKVTQ